MPEPNAGPPIQAKSKGKVRVTIEGGVAYLAASDDVEVILIDHDANVTGIDDKYYYEGDVVPSEPFLSDEERMNRVPLEFRELPEIEPIRF